MATLNGTIQPPPQTWDPFGSPAPGGSTLMQNDPYLPGGQFEMPQVYNQMQRFLQRVALDYHWFAGHGTKERELGINDAELTATFALPFLYNTQTPLYLTPGFAFHFWDGPQSVPEFITGVPPADMPAVTYDAYLDAAWYPKLPNSPLGAELDVLVGVFSDFKKVTTQSLRVKGRGLAVLSLSPSFQVKGGVWYINREKIKLLPAGGIVWAPNPDLRLDILFPNPRLTHKLPTSYNTDWWWFLAGEYGGGVWTIKRSGDSDPSVENLVDVVDYNDIRVSAGLEFKRQTGLGMAGLFEVGYAFDRTMHYRSLSPEIFQPHSAFFLRAGMSF